MQRGATRGGFSSGGFGRGDLNREENTQSGINRGGGYGGGGGGYGGSGFGRGGDANRDDNTQSGGNHGAGYGSGGFGRGGGAFRDNNESEGTRGGFGGGFGRGGGTRDDNNTTASVRGGFRGGFGGGFNQGAVASHDNNDLGGNRGGFSSSGFGRGDTNRDNNTQSGGNRGGGFGGGGFGRGGRAFPDKNENEEFRNGFGRGEGSRDDNNITASARGGIRGGFRGGFNQGGVASHDDNDFGGNRGGFSNGGFGRGDTNGDSNTQSGGNRGGVFGNGCFGRGRGTFESEDNRGGIGNCFGRGGGDENRPPPSNFVPLKRDVAELYKEDSDNFSKYLQIADDDEEITVSGSKDVTVVLGSWKDAKFEPKLYENIVERSKYIMPRKIQAHVIPVAMEGLDIKGHAETGSGKTAAFMLPVINSIMKVDRSTQNVMDKPSPFAIIIEPTRELCNQVYEQGTKLAYETGVTVARAYGQYSVRENLRELQMGCDILCATPGRLKHFIFSNQVLLKNLKFLVFDEADVLLDQDFLEDIRQLLKDSNFPPKESRQTMLFSATFPDLIQRLSLEVLKEDNVMVSNQKLVSSNSKIYQKFICVTKDDKKDVLAKLFEDELNESENKTVRRTLVFVRTKRDADLIALFLTGKNFKATTINGDRPQELREKALRELRNNEVSILVSTDVCARGLDIKNLDHVVNFDLPNDAITYVHRIGRTGRLSNGVATSFFDEYDPNDSGLAKRLVEIVCEVGQTPPDFLIKAADMGTMYGTVNNEINASNSVPAPAPADEW